MLPEPELPTGTGTFFFSDIEQSTRLASRLGDGYVDVLARHREIIRAAFDAWRGREVSTGGDSFFAVFPAPTDAICAAALIQRSFDAEGTGSDNVRVRIGLHTGQAVRVGHDYVGLDVHLAARIADAGHGGQVLISEATRAALGGDPPPGLRFHDLGRHRLKDVGPQRLWQLEGAELPAGPFPPLRSLEAHPTNLPAAASPMVDRERELGELMDLAPGVSVLTITGPGGIGKTRLALELARALVPRFPDGVFYLDLAATSDAPTAAEALLDVLQLTASTDDGPVATLLAGLRSRDLLLVLETADRVAGLPELVAGIAAACPRIRVIVTSRSPLHVQAEREYSVAPLPRQPAVELFIARAAAVGARLATDAATSAAIERLVTRLDGIPLAIELAAARTRMFSPSVLLDRLERDLPALGAGAVDAPDRQRTLQGTIAWSCDLLPLDQQTLFRELAVFPESFDLAAVEAIGTPPSTGDIVAVLEGLVDRSLVLAEAGATGEPRFRLLGPIREFALHGLRSTRMEDAVRTRFAEHWAAFTRQLQESVEAGAGGAALQAMSTEEANLRAALRWATSAAGTLPGRGRAPVALALAGSMGRYWWSRGRVHEGLDWLERALFAGEGGRAEVDVARALYWKGVLLDDARRPDEARAALEQALSLYHDLHDDAGIARTTNSLGVVARSMGDVESAERLLNESVELKRSLGDRAGMAVSLSNFGVLATDLGRLDEAVEYMRQALAIDEEYGTGAVPVAIANHGNALIRAGRFAAGVAELRRALPGLEELGDPELVADALAGAAAAALESAEDSAPARAARLLSASTVLRSNAGLPLRAMEREELDALEARIHARLDGPAMAAAQAEVAAVDVESALAMLRDELLGKR
jgi:predicted ATPase/class 3 adenylate cyclase